MSPKRQGQLPFGKTISLDIPLVDLIVNSQEIALNSIPVTPSNSESFAPLPKKEIKKSQRTS